MEIPESHQRPSDSVEHERAHDENISEELADASAQAAVADLAAITGGEAPTEAEHNAVRTRVNLLTQVLRDAGLIPSA
jgi:hypothetical protein